MENEKVNALGAMVLEILAEHVNGKFHTLKLNMNEEDFVKSVMLIATSNCCKAQYIVPISDNYRHTYDIVIQESNAAIINELVKAGYSLSMSCKGLVVSKY